MTQHKGISKDDIDRYYALVGELPKPPEKAAKIGLTGYKRNMPKLNLPNRPSLLERQTELTGRRGKYAETTFTPRRTAYATERAELT